MLLGGMKTPEGLRGDCWSITELAWAMAFTFERAALLMLTVLELGLGLTMPPRASARCCSILIFLRSSKTMLMVSIKRAW